MKELRQELNVGSAEAINENITTVYIYRIQTSECCFNDIVLRFKEYFILLNKHIFQ